MGGRSTPFDKQGDSKVAMAESSASGRSDAESQQVNKVENVQSSLGTMKEIVSYSEKLTVRITSLFHLLAIRS
jgi:hypothetical protein